MKYVRKFGRSLGYILVVFIAVMVLAELVLQTVGLFVSGREQEGETPSKKVILAVGDSHTYGLMVPAKSAYPSRLQALLDERAPNQYRVVNLGIPAMNTAQVLDRLRFELKRYRPHIVIVWCGVNNVWNRAASTETGDGWASRVADFLGRYSRVYRFFRVWRHDRELEGVFKQGLPEQARYKFDLRRGADASHTKATIGLAGQSEQIEFFHSGYRVDQEMEERAFRDYGAMFRESVTAGAWTIFIAYPIEMGPFAAANRAVRRVFDAYRAPVVETWKSIQRLPPDQREFLWAGHPNAAAYAEIAGDVLPVVLKGKPPKEAFGLAKTLLARLDFESELKSGSEEDPVPEILVKGDCALTDTGCANGKGCYRWHPQNDMCYIQQMLTVMPLKAQLSARFRVSEYPSDSGGREVLAMLESVFGSGVALEFTETDRLRINCIGSGKGSPYCGPTKKPIARNVWYGIRLRAEKSDRANLSLELIGPDSKVIESVACTRSTGGGVFTHTRIGSANPYGATSDIVFDDVEVTFER